MEEGAGEPLNGQGAPGLYCTGPRRKIRELPPEDRASSPGARGSILVLGAEAASVGPDCGTQDRGRICSRSFKLTEGAVITARHGDVGEMREIRGGQSDRVTWSSPRASASSDLCDAGEKIGYDRSAGFVCGPNSCLATAVSEFGRLPVPATDTPSTSLASAPMLVEIVAGSGHHCDIHHDAYLVYV
jgi:hypothetical protein